MAIYDLLYASVNPIDSINGISVTNPIDYFVQTTPPILFGTGDIWFNPASNTRYIGLNGQWVLDDGTGQTTYGQHLAISYAATQPDGSSAVVGDYWYDSGTNTLYQWNSSTWVVVGGTSSAGATAPSSPAVNDTWYNSTEKTLYKWNGYTWVAQTSTAPPSTTAPTKTPTTISETAPTNPVTGDLWYVGSTGILSRWSGAAWIAVYGVKFSVTTLTGFVYKQLIRLADVTTKLPWIQKPIVGGKTTFSYSSIPLVEYFETFPYEELIKVPFDLTVVWDIVYTPVTPVTVTTQFGYAFASPYITDSFDMPYSILTTRLRFPIIKTFEADYAIPAKVFASSITTFAYSECVKLSNTVVLPYAKVVPITNTVVAPYGNASKLNIKDTFLYSSLSSAKSSVTLSYSLVRPVTVKVTTEFEYHSLKSAKLTTKFNYGKTVQLMSLAAFNWKHTTPVSNTVDLTYEISSKQYVFLMGKFGYSIENTNVQSIDTQPVILKDGEALDYIVINLSTDESSPYWVGDVSLANIDDFSKFNVGDTLTLQFVDQEFHMLVDNKTLSRGDNATQSCVITLISIAAMFDNPFSSNVTKYYDTNVSAKQVVEELLGPVTWNTQDWLIPLSQAQFTGLTPLGIARKITASVGALIESLPNGDLVVRNTYPVSIPEYATADAYALADSDLFSVSEYIAPKQLYNRVDLYTNTLNSSVQDFIEFTSTDPVTNLAGYVSAYPSPYRESTLTSTGTAVVKEALGDVTRIESEIIEFKGGKASTRYPISSVISMQWDTTNLGGITFEGKNVSSAILAESLLKISYSTKCKQWNVEGSEISQFVLADA